MPCKGGGPGPPQPEGRRRGRDAGRPEGRTEARTRRRGGRKTARGPGRDRRLSRPLRGMVGFTEFNGGGRGRGLCSIEQKFELPSEGGTAEPVPERRRTGRRSL